MRTEDTQIKRDFESIMGRTPNLAWDVEAQTAFITNIARTKWTDDELLPTAAYHFVNSYLTLLAQVTDAWLTPEIIKAALPIMLNRDGTQGDPSGFAALIVGLVTATDGYEFRGLLEKAGVETDRSTAEQKRRNGHYEAAEKAARLLADPRTPQATKNAIQRAIGDLANATDVQVGHPALAEFSLRLMFESMSKRVRKETWTPTRREAYRQLIELLATVEEGN